MRTRQKDPAAESIMDKRRLQAIGVLLPVRLKDLSFLPGRHPLGRAGEGMRFLRSRPFEPGEDNPRDIDKFSAEDDCWVNESESEVQASIYLLCDISASMAFPGKASVRNLALMQLTYSLWRASDRVRAIFYSKEGMEEYAERNLKNQLEKLGRRLANSTWQNGLDVTDALAAADISSRGKKNDIIFIISDFSPVSSAEDQFSISHWRSMMRKIPGDLVPVIISFTLSNEVLGMCKFWDPERHQQRLTLLTPARIARINSMEKQRVVDLEGFFRKLGLDYLVLRQQRDVYPQLARLTGLRRRRKL